MSGSRFAVGLVVFAGLAALSCGEALSHGPAATRQTISSGPNLSPIPMATAKMEWLARHSETPRLALAPSSTERERRPIDLRCAAARDCPEWAALVVFPGSYEPVRCSAVLIGPDRILTAAHCLPEGARRAGASCGEGLIGFPESAESEPVWVGCQGVDFADPVGDDQVLRHDVAVLRLERPMIGREVASLGDPEQSTPVGTVVRVVSVTPHPIYRSQHQIEVRLCRTTDAERAVRALGERARRVGWLSDCSIVPGHSGSAVLGLDGRIEAIIHAGSNPFYGLGVASDVRHLQAQYSSSPQAPR